MDQYFKLSPGMRVVISNETAGKYTKDTQGWESQMDRYIGTIQVIEKIIERTHDHDSILFKKSTYHWDTRDLTMIPSIPEVKLKGKKQQFNVTELS